MRFLAYKITPNIRRIYMDVYDTDSRVVLSFVCDIPPSELELELIDDIETNSSAHMPDYAVFSEIFIRPDYDFFTRHDFVIFAFNDDLGDIYTVCS